MAFQTLLGRCAAAALQIWVFSVIAARLGADFAIGDRSIKYRQSTLIASQTNRSTEIVIFSPLLGSAVILFELTTVHAVIRTVCRRTQLPFIFRFLLNRTGRRFRFYGTARNRNVTVFMPPTVLDYVVIKLKFCVSLFAG